MDASPAHDAGSGAAPSPPPSPDPPAGEGASDKPGKAPGRKLDFVFSSLPETGSFDTGGVLYWMGTHGGTRPYSNCGTAVQQLLPDTGAHAAAGRSVLVSSSKCMRAGDCSDFTAHAPPGRNTYVERSHGHSWLAVDLNPHGAAGGDEADREGHNYGLALSVHHYALRHGGTNGGFLRHWMLQGSNDGGETWKCLSEHGGEEEGDASLQAGCDHATASWPVVPQEPFRAFRIVTTGDNSGPAEGGPFYPRNLLVCGGIELYGVLYGAGSPP